MLNEGGKKQLHPSCKFIWGHDHLSRMKIFSPQYMALAPSVVKPQYGCCIHFAVQATQLKVIKGLSFGLISHAGFSKVTCIHFAPIGCPREHFISFSFKPQRVKSQQHICQLHSSWCVFRVFQIVLNCCNYGPSFYHLKSFFPLIICIHTAPFPRAAR